MGEQNDPVDYLNGILILQDWLAKYLYEHYETNPYPSHDPDAGIGNSEPWESAGKRMRERWEENAEDLLADFIKLFKDF